MVRKRILDQIALTHHVFEQTTDLSVVSSLLIATMLDHFLRSTLSGKKSKAVEPRFAFKFDGEKLDLAKTPDQLELEDDE
eukprot:SAG11_NODE_2626_length_3163_cov_1.351175_1_plen_80_part_00